MLTRTARLLIACPDRRGIIAAVSGFLAQYDGNILEADQHTDPEHGEFFMRVEIDIDGFRLGPDNFPAAWQPLADKFRMRWAIHWGTVVRRMAIFVSRLNHCLLDLLWRWKSGEFNVDIPLVVSNHVDLQDLVSGFGIPFHHLPVTPDTKASQERAARSLLDESRIDFIVLARYMQVLSPDFVAAWP